MEPVTIIMLVLILGLFWGGFSYMLVRTLFKGPKKVESDN
jgi:hypothetical protein